MNLKIGMQIVSKLARAYEIIYIYIYIYECGKNLYLIGKFFRKQNETAIFKQIDICRTWVWLFLYTSVRHHTKNKVNCFQRQVA